MSDDWRSISDSPCAIHSATARPTPGPSFTQTAAADQSPRTSGVSPSSGSPSGVSESRPLIAYLMPTDSSPRISGTSSSASSSCCSKSSCVNGSSVGVSDDSSIDGISSGSWRIGRCAYEPTSRPCPSWRSYMFVSMSRTIGKSTAVFDERNRGTGPTSIIWCTAGGSGIDPPVLDVDTEHLGVRKDLRALRLRLLAHDRAEALRVDDGDRRRVEAAEQDRLVDERDELLDLRRRHEAASLDAPRLRRRHPAAQLLQPLLGARHLDAAALVQRARILVLAHRVEGELRHLLRVVDREDEVRCMARRAARVRERPLVELDEVGPAELGEPAEQRVADDAAADHDATRPARKISHSPSHGQEHAVHRLLEVLDMRAHRVSRAVAVTGPDRLEKRPVLGDRLLELVSPIEGDRPDPQGKHVVLLERRLEEIVVRRAVHGAVDPLV